MDTTPQPNDSEETLLRRILAAVKGGGGGGEGGVSSWNDLTDKPTEFPPEEHDHAWSEITDKPTEFPPEAHTHDPDEINQASAALGNVLAWDGEKWAPAGPPTTITVAASDETTAITAGNGKVSFRMPYAMTVTAVRASLTTAQASGNIFTVDVNEAGSSILGTKLTIDNTEKTSTTAAAAATITDATLADDAEITIDVDQVGDGTAKGLKVTLIGTIS
jgi:hypothetical protein